MYKGPLANFTEAYALIQFAGEGVDLVDEQSGRLATPGGTGNGCTEQIGRYALATVFREHGKRIEIKFIGLTLVLDIREIEAQPLGHSLEERFTQLMEHGAIVSDTCTYYFPVIVDGYKSVEIAVLGILASSERCEQIYDIGHSVMLAGKTGSDLGANGLDYSRAYELSVGLTRWYYFHLVIFIIVLPSIVSVPTTQQSGVRRGALTFPPMGIAPRSILMSSQSPSRRNAS